MATPSLCLHSAASGARRRAPRAAGFGAWLLGLWRLWLVVAALACALPALAETPLPAAHDLRASAAKAAGRGQPLVLMFSLPGCTYCEQLRRSTYRWMVRDGVDVEQVEMLASYHLVGFDGRPTDGQALAAHYRVGLAPTVLFLGPGGRELGERLAGAGEPDFYQAYVDRSMAQARAHLRGG